MLSHRHWHCKGVQHGAALFKTVQLSAGAGAAGSRNVDHLYPNYGIHRICLCSEDAAMVRCRQCHQSSYVHFGLFCRALARACISSCIGMCRSLAIITGTIQEIPHRTPAGGAAGGNVPASAARMKNTSARGLHAGGTSYCWRWLSLGRSCCCG